MKKTLLLAFAAIMIAVAAHAQSPQTVIMPKGASLSQALADKVKTGTKVTVTNMIGGQEYEGKNLDAILLRPGKYFLRKEDEPHTIVLIVTE